MSIAEVLPVLGLRIDCGEVSLRGITDDDLPVLAELALLGIHEPGWMPFLVPWTEFDPAELPLRFAQYHWRSRADFGPEAWTMNLGVWHRERLVGVQGLTTERYLVTRTGETGSWLGRAHQGQGLGTTMRQVICAFAFDHLEADEITSGAFVDNAASRAVSRKVGYRENGVSRRDRGGRLAEHVHLVLRPDDLVRPQQPIEVTGGEAFRRSVGLDAGEPR